MNVIKHIHSKKLLIGRIQKNFCNYVREPLCFPNYGYCADGDYIFIPLSTHVSKHKQNGTCV